MRSAILLIPLALGACVATPRLDRAGPAATPFSPQLFFAGRTEGDGTLRKILSKPDHVLVHGSGRIDPDGVLVVDQIVLDGAKPPKHRAWRISEIAPGRYAGTLSDAAGPIAGDASANRLHLHFRMKGGLDAQQWLTLAPDRRSAHNIMRIHKLGILVASLDETIRKVD